MNLCKILAFIILMLLLCGCTNQERYDLVFQNVGLFDGEEDHGIVNIGINADTIAIITKEQLRADSIKDATGKYIMPGMVNSHTHIWNEEHLKEGYENGILAYIGLNASNPERDKSLKELSNEKGYPFYFTSGYAATVPGGHPTQISYFPLETINDSVSVRAWVNNRLAENVDLIKVVRDSAEYFGALPLPTLPYDSIRDLIKYAQSKGLKTVAHTSGIKETIKIADFQPDGFVHDNPVKDSILTSEQLDNLKKNNVFVIPTAILNVKSREFAKPDSPRYKYIMENKPAPETVIKNIELMHGAGIMIVAGTDAGAVPFVNWGNDLLYELDIYSKAGMSNIEVLKTATGNASEAWDIPIGKLGLGSKLNMVLLKGNPIQNLENLKEVERVWKTEKL